MPTHTSPFTVRAYAKLNLALAVGPPRDAPGDAHDGYHPICSYMHAIDLCDEVRIERLDPGEPSRFDIAWLHADDRTTPVEWQIGRDLVYRAHRGLESHLGQALPCAITVRKSIPAGGGLGGGSSDAAVTLMGLDRVFELGLGYAGLMPIAMALGSDLGFFLDDASVDGATPPRPAVVSGFGERIERVRPIHAGTGVTLILPPFGCATGAVYRAYDRDPGSSERFSAVSESVRSLARSQLLDDSARSNDLLDAAIGAVPRLRAVYASLSERLGVPVSLSGSGSTLFVLGLEQAQRIREVVPDCRVVRARLV